MTIDHADYAAGDLPPMPDGPELADALARRKNAQPIRSADDLACEELFDSDDELTEFLDDTYAARRASLA